MSVPESGEGKSPGRCEKSGDSRVAEKSQTISQTAYSSQPGYHISAHFTPSPLTVFPPVSLRQQLALSPPPSLQLLEVSQLNTCQVGIALPVLAQLQDSQPGPLPLKILEP